MLVALDVAVCLIFGYSVVSLVVFAEILSWWAAGHLFSSWVCIGSV